MDVCAIVIIIIIIIIIIITITITITQGSKKTPSGRPGQVDFPFGQVTFSPSLPDGQAPRQAVRQLNFW